MRSENDTLHDSGALRVLLLVALACFSALQLLLAALLTLYWRLRFWIFEFALLDL